MGGGYLALSLPGLLTKRRGWVLVIVALAALDAAVLFLPLSLPSLLPPLGRTWNWDGKLASLALTSLAAILLIGLGGFRGRDFGLTLAQAPGTARAVVLGILPFLVLDGVFVFLAQPHEALTRETLLFEATLPGLDEEFLYRGVMLALLDRVFAARVNVLGARVGYGALAVTLVFGLAHAVGVDRHLIWHIELLPGAFATVVGLVLVWIRARTQSLVWPVLTHNAVNVINDLVAAMVPAM